MVVYKNKYCSVCNKLFKPTSPNQKYCSACKEEGKKSTTRLRDRKRSRAKYNYKEYTKYCEVCGKEFVTYYSRKRYCGSEECEKERIRRKNKILHQGRDKELENIRKTWYYHQTKDKRLLQKAIKYRELHNTDKEYNPRGFQKHTITFVRNYVEQFGYKLVSKEYKSNRDEIILLCPEGHEWKTTFHNFKDGNNRCLECYLQNNYTSRPEQKILDYFMDNYPELDVIHNDRDQIGPLELDLYFSKQRVAVEVCGLYWHSEISGGKNRSYHYDKMIKCSAKNIRLITVFEDEINDKFELVISRILQALHLTPNRIYARQCSVKIIDNTSANKFFTENHLQGRTQAKISWGLFYGDELVAACSIGGFIRKHAAYKNSIELKRFCSKTNFLIVGGFSKMFKQVVSYCVENNITNIVSYCDMRYANILKPVYETIGFKLNTFTKYTPHYVKNGKRYRNFSLRKTKVEQKMEKTEFELRLAQGYDRIWDCGHRSYLYTIS